MAGPGGSAGGTRPSIHAPYDAFANDGISGWREAAAHATGVPHRIPVPRGPISHLWQPAARKSMPGPGSRTSSAASAWTPSTQRSTFAPRRSPASRTTAAISPIGSFTPVLECTHVIATARVRGPIAARRRAAISSADAVAGVLGS